MSNKKPTLYAYAVKDRGRNQKAIWTRIGAAWPHEKGRGFSIQLEALPARRSLGAHRAQGRRPGRGAEPDTFEGAAKKAV